MRQFARLFAVAVVLIAPAFLSAAWAADPVPKTSPAPPPQVPSSGPKATNGPLPESFYGSFAGTGLSETRPDGKPVKVQPRDFDVTISPKGEGFTVGWKTTEYTIRPGNSKIEKEKTSIDFQPASRPGIYKTDLAPDVIGGEPVYWAVVQGDTLLVYRMVVYGDGKFEIAVWTRTIMKDGKMKLEFNRYGNGTTPRKVTGVLTRTP